jgi:hypothetical protein
VAGPSGKGARPEAARPSAATAGGTVPGLPFLESGAERKRPPRWRTIRVITTTRRLGEALRSLGDLVAVTDAARRGLKSSSCIVMAGSVFADSRDGARGFEIVRVSGESASRSDWLNVLKLQSNQPHAPCRRRRFYLAFPGWGVTVRSLHSSSVVRFRTISGSLRHWRISSGFETLPEQRPM